ncbi:MAG: ATP-binding protein [Bacteroidota bacterium]
MKQLSTRTLLVVTIDVALLLLCLTNIPALVQRATAPFEVEPQTNRTVVSKITHPHEGGGVAQGDELLTWGTQAISGPRLLEYLSDRASIGDSVRVNFKRGDLVAATIVTLVPYYGSLRFAVITGFVGIMIWCVGLFILLVRPRDFTAAALHWALISLAALVMLTQGQIDPLSPISYLRRAGLLLAYAMTPGTFLYFMTLFPRPVKRRVLNGFLILTPPVLFALVLVVLFLRATVTGRTADFVGFDSVYDVFRIMVFVYGAATILTFVRSYAVSGTSEERKKLQWVLWGFVIGPTPFLLLIIVPQLLMERDWIPEEYAFFFVLAVPLSMAVSFLKYKLLDIEVLINRSIVYTTLSILIGALYLLTVLMISSIVAGGMVFEEYFFVIVVSLAISLLVNPIRLRLQRFVDEILFPVRVHYHRTIQELGSNLHAALTSRELFMRLLEGCVHAIPSSAMGVYTIRGDDLVLQHSIGNRLPSRVDFPVLAAEALKKNRILALKEPGGSDGQEIDGSQKEWLERSGFTLAIPVLGETRDLLAVVAVNPRVEGESVSEEEIDFLATSCNQAAEILDRLRLQEQVILEQEERKKTEELNKLKSYFVSSVSHELRMPLTSIRMFAETLAQRGSKSRKENREYLEIIQGESERLSRLIDNVLDFSKIERGRKEYRFAPTEVALVIRNSVNAMRYQFDKNEVKPTVKVASRLPRINADADALEEVIMNLLSNALKYSGEKKIIRLNATRSRESIVIEVSDKGVGIAASEIPNLFEKFYRVENAHSKQVGGTGLGLSLVKHMADAHGGTISVKSAVGKGSTFTLRLPIAH